MKKFDNEELNKIMEEMRKVPFGNSIYQIATFTGGKETVERRYRTALLNLSSKLDALKASEFRRRKSQLDLEDKMEELESEMEFLATHPDSKSARRNVSFVEIEIEEIEYALGKEEKLIEDAQIEVSSYYEVIKECRTKLPENFTRIDFENAEQKYFLKKLANDVKQELKQIGRPEKGSALALAEMGFPIEQIIDPDTKQVAWSIIGAPNNLLEAKEETKLLPETILTEEDK